MRRRRGRRGRALRGGSDGATLSPTARRDRLAGRLRSARDDPLPDREEGPLDHVVDSPIGPLRLVADGGALCAVAFAPRATPGGPALDPVLAAAARQLAEYFAGAREAFDLPLRLDGTPFQRRVWSALRSVPFGTTRTYADIARDLGRPAATRAVGAANARNPLAIVVPCHRVVGRGGRLTGYAGGVAAKRWLLAHEARVAAPSPGALFEVTPPTAHPTDDAPRRR